jgi:hypothetical protein
MAKDTNADQVQTGTEHDSVEKLGHALDEWRTRVDELLVQFDLGASNVRDEVRKRLEVAENVYLAARSQLANARHDASSNLDSARQGVEQVIADLRRAMEAMEAVVRRNSKD